MKCDRGIFQGANVENASYNLGICAERVALSIALMNGASKIEAIAICCLDAETDSDIVGNPAETMPCGGCRQWMAELAPKALILTNGLSEPMTVKELLPSAFTLKTDS